MNEHRGWIGHWQTQNFDSDEFRCSCCGIEDMNVDFISKLQRARDIAGVPFIINSGYRCAKHNAEVGGTLGSSHLIGRAADISVYGAMKRFTILSALLEAGLTRIGIRQDFIHVDIDERKTEKAVWLYDPN